MSEVRWTPEAAADLQAIRDFIARDSPQYAIAVVTGILDAIDQLGSFVRSGRIVPELGREDVREVIRRPYRIVYRVLPGEVAHILTIFQGSKLLPRLPDE